jgi:hypothetical protein
VVQLRPRRRTAAGPPIGAGASRWTRQKPQSPVDDLAKYQRIDDAADHRRRMTMNVLALSICVVLIVSGLWLASVIAEMRDLQDCVLSGRNGCAPVHGAGSDSH